MIKIISSKPGQHVFMLDSSKVKRCQLQVPGGQHQGGSTDSDRRRDPTPWAANVVTHCTNISTKGTPWCKATWKPWAQQAETSTFRQGKGAHNPLPESCRQVITTSIYRSSGTSMLCLHTRLQDILHTQAAGRLWEGSMVTSRFVLCKDSLDRHDQTHFRTQAERYNTAVSAKADTSRWKKTSSPQKWIWHFQAECTGINSKI